MSPSTALEQKCVVLFEALVGRFAATRTAHARR